MLESYQDLRVWQLGIQLAVDCYQLTRQYPRDELYGLSAQIRRAVTSIPANIAEGYGRGNRGEYLQFLRIAQGSLKELETHLILSQRIGITTEDAIKPLICQCDDLGKMLGGLIKSLKPKNAVSVVDM